VVPRGGRCWPSGGSRVFYMRDILILKEICALDKIYILVGTFLGSNILLVIYYRHCVRTISSTFGYWLYLPFFRCRNTSANKNDVALLSQIIFLSYYIQNELLHFGIYIHLEQCLSNCGPQGTGGPRRFVWWSAVDFERKGITKIVIDTERIKNKPLNVCVKIL
jgi:hypothetical protein